MRHLSRKLLTLQAVLMLLVSASCMAQKNGHLARTTNGTRLEVDRTRVKSEQYLVQGDYKSAIAVYADACRKYPGDQALLTNYGKTLEEIHRAAGEAFSKEDFFSSGLAYHVLLKNNSSCHGLHSAPPLDKEFLLARLDDCRSRLLQRALAEYRKGNLAEAISIWKNILAFDPTNADVMKAVDTATIQLKNLQ